ncbi:hypothetical protein [Ekhidna sp.]|uniref:hypothetical protein n=1 Tax=Ekhidna sp. TaxID=2608089 RepID=UPI003C7B375A
MKTIKQMFVISLAAIGMTFTSCSEDDFKPLNDGEVQFSFQAPADTSTGGRAGRAESSASPANVVITIEDNTGEEIYSLEKMPLIEFSGSYVTDPLTLSPGSYKVTEFLVTDEDDNTIYAAPKSGSDVAYLVTNPLDIDFSIVGDQVTSISPEVLSTALLTAAEFGYASITFSTVETFDILISAMRYVYFSGWKLTDATVVIKGDGTAILNKNIASETTQLTVNDGYESYEIIVSKPGYTTVSGTFTNAEMKTFFDSPLVAQLTAQ